ncbi:BCCT family transporter [Paucibacter sp. O1-1]|nr:BCCT family transporter [Paucibacter sp. O1-1]MDA3830779.1 BCCT family transporter [Paucibacter sp. O1-1]
MVSPAAFANTIALIQTGVEQALGLDIGSLAFRIGMILIIAALFTLSSLAGLNNGIGNRLSQFNSLFMVAMLVLVIALVNPLNTLQLTFESTLNYIKLLPKMSLGLVSQNSGAKVGFGRLFSMVDSLGTFCGAVYRQNK